MTPIPTETARPAASPDPAPEFLTRDCGRRLAFLRASPAREQARPLGFLWCGGFRSNMRGGKAEYLAQAAPAHGFSFLRFDYSGHGESEGRFADGVLGDWLADARAMLEHEIAARPNDKTVIIGSSMGAWIATLLAIAMPERVAGLVLVAPALDFTQRLMRPALPPAAREALAREGVWLRPSAYGDGPYPITARLLAEAETHLLLDAPEIPFDGPVRILQGQADDDVPFAHALATAAAFRGQDVATLLVKDGDHRLSRPQDLEQLGAIAFELAARLV